MLVYRVEHATTGKGAYAFLGCIRDAGSSHPCPTGDYRWKAEDTHYSQLAARWRELEVDGMHVAHYFGCKSLKQIRRWFGGATAAELRKRNAVVRVYRVHRRDVLKGFEQVAFVKCRATLIATLDPGIIAAAPTTKEERKLQVQAYVEMTRQAGYILTPITITAKREVRCLLQPRASDTGDALLTRTRTPIKRRNAITELWNDGHSVPEIAHQIGVSTDRINNA